MSAILIRFMMRFCLLVLVLSVAYMQAACLGNENDWRAHEYIEKYKQLAMDEMISMGVPASIKLAQGMLETEYGTSRLSNTGRNHFGIKCKDYWVGDTILVDDDAPQECFRRYLTAADSFRDHSMFLRYHPKQNYVHLFELDKRDYFGWAYGLKEGGYATNARYAESLIALIERYELYQYDDVVLAKQKGEAPRSPIAMSAMYKNAATTQKPATTKPLPQGEPVRIFRPQNTESAPTPATTQASTTQAPTQEATLVKKFIALAQAPLPTNSSADQAPATNALDVRELLVNNTHALIANKELSVFYVAYLYGIPMKKLYQYNELDHGLRFKAGLPIFLAPKQKQAAKGHHTYTAQTGESLYDVAQRFGIQLKKLNRLNPQLAQANASGGEVVKLR
ncbi:MAG: glucosaminidase domain-containing protein [Chitinophagales bacterium]|nr:glucosaminidase domain-containing protein [Chitinophagales bacterium]